jgi:hypothetical protein
MAAGREPRIALRAIRATAAANLLASLVGSNRDTSPTPGDFYIQVSDGSGFPSPPLDMTTTASGLHCRRDLHPLEQQLASLH